MGESFTTTNQGLRLLLALDSSFEPLAAVALLSVLRHNQVEQVLVVTPEGTQLTQLPRIAECFNTPFQERAIPAGCPSARLAPNLRPYFYCIEAIELACNGDAARYLYIDSDTLCLRDLSELSRLPLGPEQPLAACSHGRPMVDRALLLGLESPYHYFNAGVILFDTAALNQKLNSELVVSYYEANQAICRFREQCALNGLLKGKVRYLPNQYNYLSWMRPRAQHLHWQQVNTNSMAYCLPDVRNQLAIAHLSAGALPTRFPIERLEDIDHYWLHLSDWLACDSKSTELIDLPDYSSFNTERQGTKTDCP